jgi:gluconolactonase
VLRKPKPHAPHSGKVIGGVPGPARFDSLAVLANGNICGRHPHHRHDHRVHAGRAIARTVKMPDIYPTNICFGGADMRTAYITLSDQGQLGIDAMAEPGLKLNFN